MQSLDPTVFFFFEYVYNSVGLGCLLLVPSQPALILVQLVIEKVSEFTHDLK